MRLSLQRNLQTLSLIQLLWKEEVDKDSRALAEQVCKVFENFSRTSRSLLLISVLNGQSQKNPCSMDLLEGHLRSLEGERVKVKQSRFHPLSSHLPVRGGGQSSAKMDQTSRNRVKSHRRVLEKPLLFEDDPICSGKSAMNLQWSVLRQPHLLPLPIDPIFPNLALRMQMSVGIAAGRLVQTLTVQDSDLRSLARREEQT